MPSSMTHSYFGVDVFNKLDKGTRNHLKNHIEELKTFAQGHDPYLFYDFRLTKRAKKVYKISNSIQHIRVNDHFVSLINYINDKDFYSKPEVISYLYGQICHFVLDSIVHPFVIYNTGIYNEKNKETYKYNGLHEEMEYYIDIYLIASREGVLPRKFKVYKEIFNIGKFSDELKEVIDNVMKEVYGFDNVSDIYYKSIMDMKKFYYIFNYDKYGVKKRIYKIMDLVCGNGFVRKEELSFCVDPNSKLYYLNNDKKKWNHPCNKDEIYYLSFKELYDSACDKTVNIITEVDKMLKSRKIDNDKIRLLFGNLDYTTGKDCKLKLPFKYFKF